MWHVKGSFEMKGEERCIQEYKCEIKKESRKKLRFLSNFLA